MFILVSLVFSLGFAEIAMVEGRRKEVLQRWATKTSFGSSSQRKTRLLLKGLCVIAGDCRVWCYMTRRGYLGDVLFPPSLAVCIHVYYTVVSLRWSFTSLCGEGGSGNMMNIISSAAILVATTYLSSVRHEQPSWHALYRYNSHGVDAKDSDGSISILLSLGMEKRSFSQAKKECAGKPSSHIFVMMSAMQPVTIDVTSFCWHQLRPFRVACNCIPAEVISMKGWQRQTRICVHFIMSYVMEFKNMWVNGRLTLPYNVCVWWGTILGSSRLSKIPNTG